VFGDDVKVVGKKELWGMTMEPICRIGADMGNQGYDWPDWI